MNRLRAAGIFAAGAISGALVSLILLELNRASADLDDAITNKIAPKVIHYRYESGEIKLREEWVGAVWGKPTVEPGGLVSYEIDDGYVQGERIKAEWFSPDGHLLATVDTKCDDCENSFFFDENGAIKKIMHASGEFANGPSMVFEPPVKPAKLRYFNSKGGMIRELVLNEDGEYE